LAATTQHLKEVTLASGIPNVGVLDPATAINKYVALLKAQGIKQFVVLIHEGGETDPATGQVTGDIVDVVNHLDPSISAVVSAHSHQKYVTRINGILVTQAQSYAKAFAEIDMTVDRNTGETIKTDGKIITNDERGIAPDPTVAQMVSKFQHIVAPKTQRVAVDPARRHHPQSKPGGRDGDGYPASGSPAHLRQGRYRLDEPRRHPPGPDDRRPGDLGQALRRAAVCEPPDADGHDWQAARRDARADVPARRRHTPNHVAGCGHARVV